MYVITAHQRYRQTDGRTDVKRSHDRYIAKACSGKNICISKNDMILKIVDVDNKIVHRKPKTVD